MNLKKKALTLFAASAMTLSFTASLVGAQDTESTVSTSNVQVNEGGQFNFNFWAGSITFDPATVSTTQSQTVVQSGANHRVLMVNDSHSFSEGYRLQMTASDLVVDGTGYFIDNENLSVKRVGGGPHSSCMWSGAPAPVGGNPYQSVTFDLGSTYTPLDGAVPMITGSEGRGCGGPYQSNYGWQLTVPAGTFTDGGDAVYNGNITISNMGEVGG